MTHPTDPNFRQDYQREIEGEGLTAATWASLAFIVLLFGGVAIWAYYSDPATTTASIERPGIERSVPPATTGQRGGAVSKMPATKDSPQ